MKLTNAQLRVLVAVTSTSFAIQEERAQGCVPGGLLVKFTKALKRMADRREASDKKQADSQRKHLDRLRRRQERRSS